MEDRSTRERIDPETVGLFVLAVGVTAGVAIAVALPRGLSHLALARVGVMAVVAIGTGSAYSYVVRDRDGDAGGRTD